jgi:hypothetical protein
MWSFFMKFLNAIASIRGAQKLSWDDRAAAEIAAWFTALGGGIAFNLWKVIQGMMALSP